MKVIRHHFQYVYTTIGTAGSSRNRLEIIRESFRFDRTQRVR